MGSARLELPGPGDTERSVMRYTTWTLARLGQAGQRPGTTTVQMLRRQPAQAGATARVRRIVSTYSTSEISTCLVDSRVRASQETTGTSDEIASASRTSSALWYCTPSKQLIATRYG